MLEEEIEAQRSYLSLPKLKKKKKKVKEIELGSSFSTHSPNTSLHISLSYRTVFSEIVQISQVEQGDRVQTMSAGCNSLQELQNQYFDSEGVVLERLNMYHTAV